MSVKSIKFKVCHDTQISVFLLNYFGLAFFILLIIIMPVRRREVFPPEVPTPSPSLTKNNVLE